MRAFLKRKNVEISLKRYGVDAMSAMALGLFSSLIIGLILSEIGTRVSVPLPGGGTFSFGFLAEMGNIAKETTGFAIGVAVAFGLKAPPLVLFASAATGFAGFTAGGRDPATAFIASLIGAEFGKLVSKETKLDIIITPVTTIITGMGVAFLVGPAVSGFMNATGQLIMWATERTPVLMGAVVSVVMGIVLTLPISSAALGIMLNLGGLAAGAACAGCAANMVGFAVASYRENKVSGLVSQGLGTSMLQVPNIVKNPRIWLPAIAASAVTGPLSAAVFKMENIPTGSGMGTSGLVGQFGALTAMGYTPSAFLKIALVHFIFPAVISLIVSEFMRRKNWIKPGDMKLEI